jgi:hypothetical protein
VCVCAQNFLAVLCDEMRVNHKYCFTAHMNINVHTEYVYHCCSELLQMVMYSQCSYKCIVSDPVVYFCCLSPDKSITHKKVTLSDFCSLPHT